MKLWKKVLAAVTAGMLCLGCAGVSGLQGVLGSVSAVLPVCAAENDTAYTVTVPVGTRTTQLTYAVNAEDTVEITDCENDAAGDLEIPAEIDGKTVTSIGDSAFFGCTSLTSVIIPNGVANIGDSAFGNCEKLENITIPSSVTNIGDRSFAGCENLTSVIIPNSVANIGYSVFDGCTSLAEITIPSSVTSIGGNAFVNTPWLAARQEENPLVIVNGILLDGTTCTDEEIVIPNDVTSICGFAFWENHMTSVVIPDSVTSIGSYAFSDCGNLKNITIPDSVTFFGESVFTNTAWVTYRYDENPLVIINHILVDVDRDQCSGKVTIPDGVTSIAGGAFAYCNQMTEISIPDSVNSIGSFAFNDCMTLKEIAIPEGVTSIDEATFYGCYSLTSISIPKSVTFIGEVVFCNCMNLSDVYYAGTPEQWNAIAITGGNSTDNYDNYFLVTAAIHFADGTVTKPADVVAGDIDKNGDVDSTDIYYVLYYVANIAVGNDGELSAKQIAAADVDGNGTVDSTDIYYMLYYVALHGAGMQKSWEEILAK